MKRTLKLLSVMTLCAGGFYLAAQDSAAKKDETSSLLPVAVMSFSANSKDERLEADGKSIADMLTVELSKNPDVMLVDRQEIEKVLREQALNASGLADPAQATKVGYLIGARLIVTGSIFKTGDKMTAVAKIIGTETTRTVAESASGSNINDIIPKLGEAISASIQKNGARLLPVYKNKADTVKMLKAAIEGAKKPSVYVNIPERHIAAHTVDPAAQTEFIAILKDLGFDVVANQEDAAVTIKGEGFSETGIRRGELVGVRARLEVRAVDKAGKILAADRQTAVSVGAAEQLAGKDALQSAADLLAARLIPKIVTK
jgi:TolB-like protein